jgi:hypothetical protein
VARHSQCVCALDCGARMHWKCWPLALTPLQALMRCRKPDSRVFHGVSWSVSRPTLVWRKAVRRRKVAPGRAFAGAGGEPVTALIDAVMCPSCERRMSNVRDRRRRGDEEVVPHGPASLGRAAFCVQSFQSRPQRSLQKHDVSNVFPTPASSDEGAFLPVPGFGLHDVAMGDQRPASGRTAQGMLWFGRSAFHVHCAVMDPALRGARVRSSSWRQTVVSRRVSHHVSKFGSHFRQKRTPKRSRIICLNHNKNPWSSSCAAMPSS